MIRNLKALGLALVAVFAMSAFAASSASAEVTLGQLTADGPVTLTGVEEGENYLQAFGEKVECPGSTYTGHAVLTHEQTEEKEHELLSNGAKEFTVTPHYDDANNNCRTGAGFFATVEENGCDFIFELGERVAEHTYEVGVDVTCPEGQAIDVSVYLDEGHTIPLCTETVGSQQGLTGLHATHTTGEADDVHIEGKIENLIVTRHKGACGEKEETENEGIFQANVTITGHDELGDPTAVTVTDTTVEA